jgi:hypothetical protein
VILGVPRPLASSLSDLFNCLPYASADNSLITDVSITTDRLLMPVRDDEHEKDVHLTIHVKTPVIESNISAELITTFLS